MQVDVTVYKGGVHADTCASFIVGDSPQSLGGDSRAARVARAARASLAAALRVCGPGVTPVGLGRAAQVRWATLGLRGQEALGGGGEGGGGGGSRLEMGGYAAAEGRASALS